MADTIVINARIWTANRAQPWAEVMAISGDRIIFVGTEVEAAGLGQSGIEVIDAQGDLVLPGFIDSHVHFLMGGANLSSVQLRDAASPEEFITRIGDFAKSVGPGEWITGGDWDHENWGGELPEKEWIDSVTLHNPVLINRLDGHMVLVNSKTLELEGLNVSTEDVQGGNIVRNDQGEPTGIFKDNAMNLVGKSKPEATPGQKKQYAMAAMDYVASHGVTSVHDVSGFVDLEIYESLRDEGNLKTRIYCVAPISKWETLKERITASGVGDHSIKLGGLKGFVDGSLGSHTAAFFEDFDDAPGEKGFFINDREDLYNWTKAADEAGLQVMIHAIGDSANHTLLDIFEQVSHENGPRDRRFRIEHAQHLHPDDIPRFGALGVIPSMQPYHVIDDGRWAEKIIGHDRVRTTYAFKNLLNSNAKLAFGSDWFVAPPIPLYGIYAAVTRRTLDDKNPGGWVPEQKIRVEEALRAYTINAAYASFEEDLKGSLEVGKLADFVIVDKNLFEIDPEVIKDVKVEKTFVGGKVVFRKTQ